MEQEQILATLNERLGQTSLSARTISEYVTENMPAEGEEFNFERHVKILNSLNGNYSADVAKFVEDYKKNYKPQSHKDDKQPDKKDDAIEPSLVEKLLNRIEALEKGNQESYEALRISSLREEVEALKDSLKVHNKNLWKDCVNEVSIEKDDTQDTVLAKVKKSYEKKLKDYFGEGAAPYGGKSAEQSQAEKQKVKDTQDAFEARMKARGRH